MTCPICADYTYLVRKHIVGKDVIDLVWTLAVADFWEMREHFKRCAEFQARIALANAQVESARDDPEAWRLAERWLPKQVLISSLEEEVVV